MIKYTGDKKYIYSQLLIIIIIIIIILLLLLLLQCNYLCAYMRFETLKAIILKITVLWNDVSRSSSQRYLLSKHRSSRYTQQQFLSVVCINYVLFVKCI